jgi:hypothetical protein
MKLAWMASSPVAYLVVTSRSFRVVRGGFASEHVDECLTSHAIGEGVDHVAIGDVGELIALLGEALNVILEGLISPLPIIMQVPRVSRSRVHALEVPDEH